MLIHCTQKLLKAMKIKPADEPGQCDPLFSWRANLITVNERQTVVLMCDSNRYTVVLYGLEAHDFRDLNQLIIQGIGNTLLMAGVNPDIIDRYIAEAGFPVFIRNQGRSYTAQLNKSCDNTHFALRHVEVPFSDSIGVEASHWPVSGPDQEYYQPDEKMLAELQRYGIAPLLKTRAFELSVRLELEPHDATRRIIVPANITFSHLHRILQAAFGWYNRHQYDFCLFEHEGQERPSVVLVNNEEDLACSEEDVRTITGVALVEYMPQFKHLVYHYDFGDDWIHYITLTAEYDEYPEKLPLLVAGEGTTPPEDVGGILGYKEFLEIMSDPSCKDYEKTRSWAGNRWKPVFDFDQVSRFVRTSLRW